MATGGNNQLFAPIKGIPQIGDALVILVKTDWNAAITDELERGCIEVLEANGLRYLSLSVPGAVELPFAIAAAARAYPEAGAAIAFGCVIRGDTPHFEYVCQSVTYGLSRLNLDLPIPVIFGVLTVNTEEQARERIGGAHGHKGKEAGLTALKMMVLSRELKGKE